MLKPNGTANEEPPGKAGGCQEGASQQRRARLADDHASSATAGLPSSVGSLILALLRPRGSGVDREKETARQDLGRALLDKPASGTQRRAPLQSWGLPRGRESAPSGALSR
jgi:hypothetical protein